MTREMAGAVRADLPPSGTLTFLFTDIEGSTRLLQSLGAAYDQLLAEHDRIIRAAVEAEGGWSFGSEGDAQNLVFVEAGAAVRVALAIQRALAAASWPDGAEVRVRMGLHTGEARRLGDDYVGLTLHETARIAAAGHGREVLLSGQTAELVRSALPPEVSLVDLGAHRLKDLAGEVRIHRLAADGLDPDPPALRTLAAASGRLPSTVTSFVGRAEVESVASLLPQARLVTLTGPGGTGKTRLALAVAAATAARFADGVSFVALDTITDPDLVPSEIAAGLGVSNGPDSPLERVVARLRDRSELLVLDNFEQVVEAAPAVSAILASCPAVSVLATSRIPLRISGEHEFAVPTLSLPAPGARKLSEVSHSEAVRLFVERGLSARHDFALTEASAGIVADIVRMLDGLPLAIELAAARLRILPLADLRDRLEGRLGVLTGGARDLPARQQTLRGAIDWSHTLLDEPDRRLFARFSVMAGGASFEAAERVCGPAAELGREIFDGIDSLSQQSLVRVSDDDGETRCSMLATIREYAAERLAQSDEADAVARRHAETYLALAEEAAPYLLGPHGPAWNARLEREHDNLRAALDWMVRADESELGMRMIVALWRFWQMRGHLIEGDERAHAVLDRPSAAMQSAQLRSRAESAAGGISYWRSRPASTHRHYRAALDAAREAGDPKLLADALYDFGFAASPDTGTQLARYTQGRPWFEESLALYRELGDRPGIASATWALSMAMSAAGEVQSAAQLAEQSLELSRELGDPFRTGWSAHLVGLGRVFAQKPDEAPPFFLEALDIFEASGDATGRLLVLGDVAEISARREEWERHWRFVGAALRLRDEAGVGLFDEAQQSDFLGVNMRFEPETDEERIWRDAGAAVPTDDIVREARTYLRGDQA